MTDLPNQIQSQRLNRGAQPSAPPQNPAPPWVGSQKPSPQPNPTNTPSTIQPTIEPIIENPPDNVSPPPEPTVEPTIYQPDDKKEKIFSFAQ